MNYFLIRFIVIALTLGGSTTSSAEESVETTNVVRTILANSQWLAEAKLCPVNVMPQRESTDYLISNNCKPGQLSKCLAECNEGSPGSCYWLGQALQAQNASLDAFEALFQRACKLGVMSGCTNRAAGMSVDAKDDEKAQACAASTFEAACAFDDPWACTMLALHLSRGRGIKQDATRALKVLEKSCKYGPEDEACFYADRIRQDILAKKDK